jgi:hypothetical protein
MVKTVKIDDYILEVIQKFRKKSKINKVKYPSDKHFVNIAVLDLLKKEGEEIRNDL